MALSKSLKNRSNLRRAQLASHLLEQRYGIARWAHESHDPISTLVGTILSQNTNDRNSTAAFESLKKRFATWDALLAASEGEIAAAIKHGGLANIKAKRIKKALLQIKERTGKLSLDFLKKMKGKPGKKDVLDFLLSLDGVGHKTASILMTFSLGIPTFPVDTHIFRVTKRLGLVPEDATLDEAHKIMDELVPDEKKATLHVNLIFLGRELCHPAHPECAKCPLNTICPSAFKIK